MAKFLNIDSNIKSWNAKAKRTSDSLTSATTMNQLTNFLTTRIRKDLLKRAFDTEGGSTKDGKWPALSHEYAIRKAMIYGDKTILRASDRLINSYMGSNDQSIVKSGRFVHRYLFLIGSSVRYASHHPDRPVIDPTDVQLKILSTGIAKIVKVAFMRVGWFDKESPSITWRDTGFNQIGDITGGDGI